MGYRGIDPAAFTNAFNLQRQMGAQSRAADQDEEARALQIERTRGINALGKNPNATPEQYIRAGDAGTGNALAGVQADQQQQMREAFPRVGQIAAQISTIGDPAQKRAAFRVAIQKNAQLFEMLGIPVDQQLAKLDTIDDSQLQQALDGFAQHAPQAAPTDVAPGHSLVRANGQGGFSPAFTAPEPNKQTDDVQEYQMAKSQGYPGTFFQYMKEVKQAGAPQINPPAGYRWNPDGSLAKIEGGPADQKPKPTEGDKKASLLLQGMRDAEAQLASVDPDINWKRNALATAIPGASIFTGHDYRKYRAAADRWASNYLYLKSGAQAGKNEVDTTVAQFFPRPGDKPDVIKQKAEARAQEMDSVSNTYELPKAGAQPKPAPPGALQYLQQHPEAAQAFQQKYGYLPK